MKLDDKPTQWAHFPLSCDANLYLVFAELLQNNLDSSVKTVPSTMQEALSLMGESENDKYYHTLFAHELKVQ